MLKSPFIFLTMLLLLTSCSSKVSHLSREILSDKTGDEMIYAFVGVNAIPMDSTHILYDQTVIIQGEKISQIGPSSEITIPENAVKIQCQGKYLLPGLADMHTHISDDNDILLLLCNGVTTVRNMADLPGWVKFLFGFPDPIKLRKKINELKLVGPTIYTAGLVLDGEDRVSPFNKAIKSSAKVEQEIINQKKRGYDLIKIYDNLSPEVFRAVVQSASRHNIPVAGHVPVKVSIDTILESKVASIEHLTGYINNNKADFVIPIEEIDKYAMKTKESGMWNCPTLVIWDKLPPVDGVDRLEGYPEMKYVSWKVKWLWKKTIKEVYTNEYKGSDYPGHMMKISQMMTKALIQRNCKLLVGTDMNFVGVFPGVSVHREMQLLVKSGLTPFEAIKAGTFNAAFCLGKSDEFGTISVGKRADLVLLKNNPLEYIANTRKIAGVMKNGIWLDEDKINNIMKRLEK